MFKYKLSALLDKKQKGALVKKSHVAIWAAFVCFMANCENRPNEDAVTDAATDASYDTDTSPPPDTRDCGGGLDQEIRLRQNWPRRCVINSDCAKHQYCEYEVCIYLIPPLPDGGW